MTIAPGSLAITSDVDYVITVAASALGTTPAEMIGFSKYRPHTQARHVAMRAARLGGHSFPHIGRAFGGRDHTTVIAACRRVEATPHLEVRAQAIADDIADTPRSLF